MCGIIGIIGKENVAEYIIDGLRRLEYRGYDSAGVATVLHGKIDRRRSAGKIRNLEELLREKPLSGKVGIGHTRWATHGAPNVDNAHPHATDRVAVVHNGIIENFASLRQEMEKLGYKFYTETDTEVVPVLITYYMDQGMGVEEAVHKAVGRLEGAFALGMIFTDENIMMAARKGSPLVVGYGNNEMYIGSDAIALAPLTSKISYLEDGDIVLLTKNSATISNGGVKVEREMVQSSASAIAIGKENFPHFMLKEIYEQPSVLGETLHAYSNSVTKEVQLPKLPFDLAEIEQLHIVACGTSYYAGLTARNWIEKFAKVPVMVDIASEYRYREVALPKKNGLAIFISQSGETADTLAALRFVKKHKMRTIAIVNVQESSLAREADAVLRTYAGPEIGVASTKAFTTQLMTLSCFTIALAKAKKAITVEEEENLTRALLEVPSRVAEVLMQNEEIKNLSKTFTTPKSAIYIGRGTAFPIALEGALKLKEISYIHAEATAAGELKHGPIALIDEKVPVVAIAPPDELFDKTASNIQEIAARRGRIILLSDEKGIHELASICFASIKLPATHTFVSPMLYAVPVQLLAYHVAVLKGTDVDQPRNLAKSVTVE
ncbi:MAG: glutamine--fructose-6-phosphate transaminase (isomerizing) [Proteobacteria bacterium]|nr:glutamine--fructose-6-phosphate transaminase (isomerizing) [Pseudomonadota bacterium]